MTDQPAIQSSFSPATGEWQIAYPERLAQHDLVYQSPPEDHTQGLPIGNGDIGAIVWTEENRLVLAINKCDIWDDRASGSFGGWDRNLEEHHTSLRHAARLIIDFGAPIFGVLYQQEFEARLALADATAHVQATTPFGRVIAESLISAEHRTMLVTVDLEGDELPACQVQLERWGSRTFAHWYRQIRREPEIGLAGTETNVEHDRIVIEQELAAIHFVVAAQVLADDAHDLEPERVHRRAGRVELAAAKRRRFSILITVVTSENHPQPRAEAHRILDAALKEQAEIRTRHAAAWRDFWCASYLAIPNDYLENIWHLVLYFANSSSRGALPPHFCNGLWGGNRDFVPWNHYFHWNMQLYVWPLHAANHAELGLPYYHYRRRQLELACNDARNRLDRPGAFYADVSDRNGNNDSGLNENHTPGPQIAMDFWRHYCYTGDDQFLNDSAWPVIREVTRYLTTCFELRDDGYYHGVSGSAYEGTQPFDDVVTDLAMLRALLPVALELGNRFDHATDECDHWREMLERLIPFQLVPLVEQEIVQHEGQRVLAGGVGQGQALPSEQVVAVGQDPQTGAWIRMRYAGMQTDYYGIPDPEMAPVFPAGVVGLRDRGTPLFQALVTQLLAHPVAVPDPALEHLASWYTSGELCNGWCPYPIALARLGLATEVVAEVEHIVSTWQLYPQGFGQWGPYHIVHQDLHKRWRVNHVRDLEHPEAGETTTLATWPFRYFTNEAMPIVATAINELLLQSHERIIRVCPATPEHWPVSFTLLAHDGMLVSVQKDGPAPEWVHIKSQRGKPCRLALPWTGAKQVFRYTLDEAGVQVASDIIMPLPEGPDFVIASDTIAGHGYLFTPHPIDLSAWQVTFRTPHANQQAKMLGSATLGRERIF